MPDIYTGGCLCGTIRYQCTELDLATVCHCRMCQKATGGFYGAFVTTDGLEWLGPEPKRYTSSNMAQRGFCPDCGTPMTFEATDMIDVAIGTLDDPAWAPPTLQINPNDQCPFTADLGDVPWAKGAKEAENEAWNAMVLPATKNC